MKRFAVFAFVLIGGLVVAAALSQTTPFQSSAAAYGTSTVFIGPLTPVQILKGGRYVFRTMANQCYLPNDPGNPASTLVVKSCYLDMVVDASGAAQYPQVDQTAINEEATKVLGINSTNIYNLTTEIKQLRDRVTALEAKVR